MQLRWLFRRTLASVLFLAALPASAGEPADVVALLSRHLPLALADPEVKKICSDGTVEKDVAAEDIARYRDNVDPAVLKMAK